MLNFILLFFTLAHASVIKLNTVQSIYKNDDRILVRDRIKHSKKDFIEIASNAILAQVKKANIEYSMEDKVIFRAPQLEDMLNVCPEFRFKEERVLSTCTSFLVKEDVLLTAGHCVKDLDDCQNNVWILDFIASGKDHNSISIPAKKIFKCERIIKRNTELDFVLIKLDRKTEREPLKLRNFGKFDGEDELVMVGHPLGMPQVLNFSIKANVSSDSNYFSVNADAFSGNSGSPLINMRTKKVEGILVKGALDFEKNLDSGCLSEKIYENEGNEMVLKMNEIL